MSLRLKGAIPRPGEVDRRYYMIDIQEGHRRVRLSTGVGDISHAHEKEQAVLDALRANIEISREELVKLVRGPQRVVRPVSRPSRADSPFVPLTLKQACDEALRDRLPWGRNKRGWADSPGRSTYAGQLKDIQRILGPNLQVTRITQSSVDAIIDDLLSKGRSKGVSKNSRATINRKMFAFFSVLRRLQERGLPAPRMPRYSNFDESDNARQFVFSREQERELFEQILLLDTLPDGSRPRKRDAHEYRDLFIFLADVGCRLTAGLNVRWSDIFEDNGITFVRFFRRKDLKGGKQRTTPLSARAAEVIKRRRTLGGSGPFSGLDKSRGQHLFSAAKRVTSFAAEKDAVIHAFRHTCATRLLQATGDIKLVQEWLGHSAIQTTADIYAKVLVDHKVSALKAFESRWS